MWIIIVISTHIADHVKPIYSATIKVTCAALLKTIPGIDRILGLVILYEVENIKRFPTAFGIAFWN